MKILFYSSMLDNAMLLDMLSNTGTTTETEGTCLRRVTSASVIDSIPLLEGKDMPVYNKYWDALRGKERSEKLRIAQDGTQSMMVHFLDDYLKNNGIKASDIEFLLKKSGKSYEDGEALVFGSKIVNSGVSTEGYSDDTLTITCKNGYIYRMDEVLLPPSNMAAELRRRDDTKVFSHLLDRFCIPVYDAPLTAEYQTLNKSNDSIFRLRYFVKDRFTSHNLLGEKYNPLADELLAYDPGWNEFANNLSKERDMAAMFVPKDEVLYDYFASGAGNFLVEQFASSVEIKDIPTLLQALDSVPEVNIVPLLNNLMKNSFAGTVPSKFDKITDDANDEMGITEKDVDECVIANNGIIYLMNNVFGPAKYEAVSAPTIVQANMLLMRNVIKQLRYDFYLLAMDAEYSFIVPDDKTFVYYDPVTAVTEEPKAYAFHYNNERPKGSGANELWADIYELVPGSYNISDTLTPMGAVNVSGTDFGGNAFMKDRMTDLIEYLIIVHDEGDGIIRADGTLNPKKYYQTKGYGTIKVDTSDPNLIRFYGGEQIENGSVITVGEKNGEKTIYRQKNGNTFCTVPAEEGNILQLQSGIPTPPTKSVFNNMSAQAMDENGMYYEFYKLCMPNDFSATVNSMFSTVKPDKAKKDSIKLYSIFYSSDDGTLRNAVPFFNTYHYTVYVPSNDAIKEQIALGLPTWEQINGLLNDSLPQKAASQMRLLNNFLRYHFQDNSVYADVVPFSITAPEGGYYSEANFATPVIDTKTGRFYETVVSSADGTLTVKDNMGKVAKVIKEGEEGRTWNVMCRDIEYKVNNAAQKIPNAIETSSFAVIQPIDRALLNDGLFGYDGRFRRFAATGEPVEIFNIAVDGSDVPYLVADMGVQTVKGNDVEKKMRVAFLMQPIDAGDPEYNEAHTREKMVLNADNECILITEEGFMVQKKLDIDKKPYYEYVTDEDGSMLKVDNNGEIIERIQGNAGSEAEN